MKRVTDPALLQALEGTGNGVPGLKPVTDPAILAQLDGDAPAAPKEKGGFWEGYGQAYANLMTGAFQRALELTAEKQKIESSAAPEFLKPAITNYGNKVENLRESTRNVAEQLAAQEANLGTSGKVGKFAGELTQTAAFPGGSTIPRAMAMAAGTSGAQTFLQPEAENKTAGDTLTSKALDAAITGSVAAGTVPVVSAITPLVRQGTNALKKVFTRGAPEKATQEAIQSTIATVEREAPALAEVIKKETPDVVEAFSANMDAGLTPEQALTKAKADSYKVRASRGDITTNFAQQAQEEDALKGVFGEDAQNIARAFREGQVSDLQRMTRGVGEKLGGGQELPETQDVGQRIMDAVKKGAKLEKKAAQKAYEESGINTARVTIPTVQTYRNALSRELGKEGFDKDLTPTSYRIYQRFDEFLNRAKAKKIKTINLQHIEGFRKLIVKAGKGSNPQDGRMLTIMRHALDDSVDDALEQGLITGNRQAIANITNARGLWQSYKQRYYGKDGKAILGKIVERDFTPEKTMDLLIGSGQLGAKKEAAQAVNQLKTVLGQDSPEFLLLKQAAFSKLTGGQLEGKAFSGTKYANNVRKLAKENKSLAEAVFKPDEWQEILDSAKFAERITTKQEGVVNYSNSGNAILRNINQIGQKFGLPGKYAAAVITKPAEAVVKRSESVEAQRAFTGKAKDMVAETPEANRFVNAIAQRLGITAGTATNTALQQNKQNTAKENEALREKIRRLEIPNPYAP